jgi:hypothetical protein
MELIKFVFIGRISACVNSIDSSIYSFIFDLIPGISREQYSRRCSKRAFQATTEYLSKIIKNNMRTSSLYRIAVCTTIALSFQVSVHGDENPVCYLCEGDASATMLSPSAVIDMSSLQIEGVTFVTCEQLQNAGLARLLSTTLCDLSSQSSELASCQCSNAVLSKAAGSIPGLSPAASPIVVSNDQFNFEKKNDKDGKTKAPKMPKVMAPKAPKTSKVMTPKAPKVMTPKATKVMTPKAPKTGMAMAPKATKAPKDTLGKGKSKSDTKGTMAPKDTTGGKGKSTKVPKDSKGTMAPKDTTGGKGKSTKVPKDSKGTMAPKDTTGGKGKSTKAPKFKTAFVDESGLEYDDNGNVNLEQFLDRMDGIPYYDEQSVPTISPSLDIDEEINTLESMITILNQKKQHTP